MPAHRPSGPSARQAPLTGRDEELRLLNEVLAGVRDGLSGMLLLVGEAGIGKTRLLDHAADIGADLRVVRIAGVESETHLGFAGLHRLLRPFLPLLDGLPAPQRDALRSAFGLSAGPPADRYLVAMATLTLLAETAARQPLVCLVDDVQWLDRESAEALAFVARRLLADAIGLVLTARPGSGPGLFDGLPTATVAGLSDVDARTLLSAAAAGVVDEAVAGRIAAETGGNPLALTEIAALLAPEQLTGVAPLPPVLPVGGLLERHFHDQVQLLPVDTRTLLALLSAAPSDDPAVLWAAAGRLGIAAEAAEPALAAGIVVRGRAVEFRHPLIRSAVYLGAAPTERRRVHEAIAAVSDAGRHPDRRAWHRAQATLGLDEEVALELEAASERARSRGGYAEQAAFLARAADLSPDPGAGAARRVAAARAYLVAGDPVAAQTMLDQAEDALDQPVTRARAGHARATVALYFNRIEKTPPILMAAAESIAALDPLLARRMMYEAVATLQITGPRIVGVSKADLGRAVLASPALDSAEPVYQDLFLRAFATRAAVGYAEAVPLMRAALDALLTSDALVEDGLPLVVMGSFAAEEVWDDERGTRMWQHMAAVDRETGALAALQSCTSVALVWEIRAGRLDAARALADEEREIAAVIGAPRGQEGALEVTVWSGDEAGARTMAAAIKSMVHQAEGTAGADFVRGCMTLLELSLGRYAEALAWVLPTFEGDVSAMGNRTLHEVVEAGVRGGGFEAAKAALARLEERAPVAGTPWALGLLARCRALMAGDDPGAEAYYLEAVELLGQTRIVAELARTHLLHGEWLRRQRRRTDARVALRTAYDMFTAMGAAGFAERARVELAATGERPRRRTAPADNVLTPQETQVATLAAAGATNAEIAVRLFITTSTVEYHLNKVFRKLEITSRRRLGAALGGQGSDPV